MPDEPTVAGITVPTDLDAFSDGGFAVASQNQNEIVVLSGAGAVLVAIDNATMSLPSGLDVAVAPLRWRPLGPGAGRAERCSILSATDERSPGEARPTRPGPVLAIVETALAQPLSGRGTAVIDGVIDNVEWQGAAQEPLQVNLPGGGTASGALYVMNDDANLHFALVVVFLGFVDIGVNFDNDGDGSYYSDGDDGIGIATNSPARDNFRSGGSGPLDAAEGGTADTVGADSTTAVSTQLEMSHPLDSGDTGRDIAVGPDDVLSFMARIALFSPLSETFYPGPDSAALAQVRILPEPGGAVAGAAACAGLAAAARVRGRARRYAVSTTSPA